MGSQLALAHAQASKDKEKFVLPLKEYRRAVDLVLTVRRLEWVTLIQPSRTNFATRRRSSIGNL